MCKIREHREEDVVANTLGVKKRDNSATSASVTEPVPSAPPDPTRPPPTTGTPTRAAPDPTGDATPPPPTTGTTRPGTPTPTETAPPATQAGVCGPYTQCGV